MSTLYNTVYNYLDLSFLMVFWSGAFVTYSFTLCEVVKEQQQGTRKTLLPEQLLKSKEPIVDYPHAI